MPAAPPRTDKNVAAALQKLPHLSLLFSRHSEAKGYGLRSGVTGAREPQLHVCFQAPNLHFITSLVECGGAEENLCHLEMRREEQISIFSSPGLALSCTCWPHVWMTLLCWVQRCYISKQAARYEGYGESEDRTHTHTHTCIYILERMQLLPLTLH